MSIAEIVELWKTTSFSQEYYHSQIPFQQFATDEALRYYGERFPEHKDSRLPFVIDVACGTGQVTETLADHCERVLGIDISPPQIDVARRMSTHLNVTYEVCSAYEFSRYVDPESNKADLITVAGSSHYFNTSQFYDEVRKCLKPGGILAEVGYKIIDFVGLPRAAFDEFFDFFEKLNYHGDGNAEYDRAYIQSVTRYETLNVLLEDREDVNIYPVTTMTKTGLRNAMEFGSLKRRDVTMTLAEFCDNFWKKYDVKSDKLSVCLEITLVFSRNLK